MSRSGAGGVPAPYELPSVANPVAQLGLTVRRHIDREGEGTGIFLCEFMCFGENLPVAPAIEILFHDDLHRLVLVIAQRYVYLFLQPALLGAHGKIALPPLPNHIKRRAELDSHVFILRR